MTKREMELIETCKALIGLVDCIIERSGYPALPLVKITIRMARETVDRCEVAMKQDQDALEESPNV